MEHPQDFPQTLRPQENQQNLWFHNGSILVSLAGCLPALSPSPPFLSLLGFCVRRPDALSRFSSPFLFPVLDAVSVLVSLEIPCV